MPSNLATRGLGDDGPEVSVIGLGCNNFGRRVQVRANAAAGRWEPQAGEIDELFGLLGASGARR